MCYKDFVPDISAVAVPLTDLHGWESFAEEGMRKKGLFHLVYISNRLSSRKGNYARNERVLCHFVSS